jgi:hypothetical protein
VGRLITDRHISAQQCNEQLPSSLLGRMTIAGGERLAIARSIRSMDVAVEISPLSLLKQPDPKSPAT